MVSVPTGRSTTRMRLMRSEQRFIKLLCKYTLEQHFQRIAQPKIEGLVFIEVEESFVLLTFFAHLRQHVEDDVLQEPRLHPHCACTMADQRTQDIIGP